MKNYPDNMKSISMVGLAAAFVVILLAPHGKGADEIPELTPEPIDRHIIQGGERLEYEFGWNGLPAGRAVVRVREDIVDGKQVLRLRTETRTTGAVRLLWKMDDWAESVVHPNTLKPLGFVMHQEEAGDLRHSVVEFDHEAGVAKVTRRHGKKVRKKEIEFLDAYDPISLVFLMRCVKYEVGKTKVFELIDGNHRYRIIIDVKATEPVSIKMGNYAAYKVQPRFVRVPPPKKTQEKILYNASIWIDIEPPHHMLLVKSKIMVGNIYGELVKVTSE